MEELTCDRHWISFLLNKIPGADLGYQAGKLANLGADCVLQQLLFFLGTNISISHQPCLTLALVHSASLQYCRHPHLSQVM